MMKLKHLILLLVMFLTSISICEAQYRSNSHNHNTSWRREFIETDDEVEHHPYVPKEASSYKYKARYYGHEGHNNGKYHKPNHHSNYSNNHYHHHHNGRPHHMKEDDDDDDDDNEDDTDVENDDEDEDDVVNNEDDESDNSDSEDSTSADEDSESNVDTNENQVVEEENVVTPTGLDDKEIVDAFTYLNQIRNNPSAFSEEIGVDLSSVKALASLNWNDTLAKVAQQKANDMVERGYFSHVDPDGYGLNYFISKAGYKLVDSWTSEISKNYFESLSAGRTEGKTAISGLIYDGGADNDNAGHRQHLLGISGFWSNCTDIGIGHAYGENSKYKHYWVVVVAKHSW